MSAAATSHAELVHLIKSSLDADYNCLGYPRDHRRFNLAHIIREAFYNSGYYGWRYTDRGVSSYREILHEAYRPKHRALRREDERFQIAGIVTVGRHRAQVAA